MSAIVEAAELIFRLSDGVQTPKERRLRAWRKVSSAFTLYRIEEIDRRSDRVRITGDELRVLRDAARAGREENEIERELRKTRERIAELEQRIEAILERVSGRGAGA